MSQWRVLTVAQGHSVKVRRSTRQTDRPGFVRVEKSHRPPFEVAQRVWDAGVIA